MIKTIKPPVKEGSKEKEDDKQSNKNSDGKNKNKYKSNKLIHEHEEMEKPHTVNNLLFFYSIILKIITYQTHKEEIHQFKLTNIEEFLEDPEIKYVRLEKEKQLKREEEEKKMKRIQEKVFIILKKST